MDPATPREAYEDRTPKSRALNQRAAGVMPGGDTRAGAHHAPYPSYAASGDGCRLNTVDGESLLDCLNNYTANVHGNAFEPVVEAVTARFQSGNSHAAPTEAAVELAEAITDRIPSVEHVRFCNSGTEATLFAIRGAIAQTGNEVVIKALGGYHGSHDTASVGVTGTGRENPGIPRDVEARVETVPFNDTAALEAAVERRRGDLACIIMEPVLGAGGMIPADHSYLARCEELAAATDALFICDEVITLRLHEGGAQAEYGVSPDLTTLGKIIGGGLPVGAFAGTRDAMSVFHPSEGEVKHSGTFTANPATMAGGCASLEHLNASAIDHLGSLGSELRARVREAAAEAGVSVTVTGTGDLFTIHFTDGPVTDFSASTTRSDAAKAFALGMRNEGVHLSERAMGCLSTPMGDAELEEFVSACERVFEGFGA